MANGVRTGGTTLSLINVADSDEPSSSAYTTADRERMPLAGALFWVNAPFIDMCVATKPCSIQRTACNVNRDVTYNIQRAPSECTP